MDRRETVDEDVRVPVSVSGEDWRSKETQLARRWKERTKRGR